MKEHDVFKVYEKLNLDENEICKKCKSENKGIGKSVGIWQYGEEFENSEYKVLFVGKTAVTNEKDDTIFSSRKTDGKFDENHDSYFDSEKRYETYANNANDLFNENYSAYWSYVKAIANELYENEAWEKIAFSNIIKCNIRNENEAPHDSTTESMKKYCALDNKVLINEIKEIKPNNIIFMVGNSYKEIVRKTFENLGGFETIIEHEIKIGAKKMPYWEFKIKIDKNNTIKCLLVGHPERLKKDEYVNKIVEFIKNK